MENYRKVEFYGNGNEFGDKGYIGYGFGYCYANEQGNGGGGGISNYQRTHEYYQGSMFYDVNILFVCI